MSSLVAGGLTLTLRGYVTKAGRIVSNMADYVEDLTGGWRPPNGFRIDYSGERVRLVWGDEPKKETP